MNQKALILVIVALISLFKCENCPVYPEPVPLSFGDPILISAFQELDTMLNQKYLELDIPGLFCSVVYGKDIFFSGGYGSVDPFNETAGIPDLTTS